MKNKFFKDPLFFVCLYMYDVYGVTPVSIYRGETLSTLIQISKDNKDFIINRPDNLYDVRVNDDNEVVSILSKSGKLCVFKYTYNRPGQLIRVVISSDHNKTIYINFKYTEGYLSGVSVSDGEDCASCQFYRDSCGDPPSQPYIVSKENKLYITCGNDNTLVSISKYEKLFKYDGNSIFFVDRKKMGSIAWKILQRKYKKALQEINN